jgi:hypothetical protein
MSNGVSGFSPIDTSGIRLQESHDPMSTSTGFDDILGKVGMGFGTMGPALDAGLQYGGLNKGASITSAAIMGFMGGGGGMSTPGLGMGGGYGGGMGGPKFMSWGGAGGTSAKFLGEPPGAPPGMTYSGGMGGGPGAPSGMGGMMGAAMGGGPQDTSGMDAQISAMFNNNMVFLAMQTKVQNITQITQMTSNIAKADSDAKLNAIRNIRS